MATQLGVIQAFMRSLDTSTKTGEEVLDAAITKACSDFKKFQDPTGKRLNIKDAFINDLKNSDSVEDFLRIYCGIDLTTNDTGAITGSDAGGTRTKTASNIIAESGSLNTNFRDRTFTIDNLTVTLANNTTFNSLSNAQKTIWQGLYTWWIKNSLDLIKESFSEYFSFGGRAKPTTKNLYINFINSASAPQTSVTNSDENGETTSVTLTINTYGYNTFDATSTEATTNFDRKIAHELTHVVMLANITYDPVYRSLPGFITEGLAELAVGITSAAADTDRIAKIKNLLADVSNFERGLDANNLAIDEDFMREGGYIFLRYLARQGGDLTIVNSRTTDTLIQTFYGNDTLTNAVGNVTITSGEGNDSITSRGDDVNIICAGGKNSITVEGSSANNTISTGSGKDYISLGSSTSNSTINVAAGNDVIYNDGSYILINAGAGNDLVSLAPTAQNSSVDGGAGNDTIHSSTSNVFINADAGKDIINIYTTTKDNAVNAGAGTDYIYIYEKSSGHTVSGGADKDTIQSEGENISISADAGADYVQLSASAKNNMVSGGEGNDSIYSGGEIISVNADAGDDYIHIYSSAKSNTIVAGKGNDTIESYSENGVLYLYDAGDGSDLIKGFTAKDTLSIVSGVGSSLTEGDNVVVKFEEGAITLEGADGLSPLNILNLVETNSTLLTVDDSTSSPVTVDSLVEVIDATTRTTDVIISGNELDNSIEGGAGNDNIYGNAGADIISGNNGNDIIDGGANNDSLVGGAGNDSLWGGAGNDKLYGNDGADTLGGGTGNDTLTGGAGNDLFVYMGGNDIIADYAVGDRISIGAAYSDIKATVNGSDVVFTIGNDSLTVRKFAGSQLSLIDSKSNRLSTIISATTAPPTVPAANVMTVTNSTSSPLTIRAAIETVNGASRSTAVRITGNSKNNSMVSGAGNDTLYGKEGNDTLDGRSGNDKIFGNEGNDLIYGNDGSDTLSGSAGNDTLYGGNGNDSLAGGDGADTLSGGTGNDILNGGAGADLFIYTGGNDIIADYATGVDTISLGSAYSKVTTKGSDVIFSFGKDSLTVKKAAGYQLSLIDSENKSSTPTIGKKTSKSNRTSTSLTITDSDKTTVTASSVVKTINASKRTQAIKITGNALANTIKSGAGNDSLYGGKGNDSLVGGKGDDKVFGNDGDDKLFGNGGADTLSGGAGADILDGGVGNDSLDGGAGNDSVVGGAGNDILRGGAGNDTLWGDAGADRFIYASGDGQDVIYGFENNDMLQITGSFSTSYDSSRREIYFRVGTTNNAITLRNYTATSFRVNGDTYRISGRSLVK